MKITLQSWPKYEVGLAADVGSDHIYNDKFNLVLTINVFMSQI